MLKSIVVALAAGVVIAPNAQAAVSDMASRFGARPMVQQISLSPDGNKVAMLGPMPGRATALVVADLVTGGDPKPILSSSGDPDRLTECRWSTNTRLTCSIYMIISDGNATLGYTRMIAIDADGSNLKELTARHSDRATYVTQHGGDIIDWLPESDGSAVLMASSFVPDETTGTLTAHKREGLGVERVDTMTMKRSIVVEPRAAAEEYISDGHGTIRIMGVQPPLATGYDSARIVYTYRKGDGGDWLPLSTYDIDHNSGFNPYAADRDLNAVYGFDRKDGRQALYRIALDGSLKRELVFARPDVDVDGLIEIGRQQRVVGVSYATDKRQTEFFDPQLKSLAAGLAKALPNLPLISFVDASAGEAKLLLYAGSDVDPGHYYLYDKATHKLGEVMAVRPSLAQVPLAPVKAITFTAADGTQIPAYLTLPRGSTGKGLPAIVMPHGGPGARDEWGFDWLAQFFANRGFAVLQPNFRGSTGYGEGWFEQNGFQSWRIAIGDINDGGRYLVKEGIAALGKLAVVGWSYGGYAALQSAVLDPDLYKAIVAIAPVTDLEMLRGEHRKFTDYRLVDTFIGNGPHVREGSPAQNAARIKAPVLLFHGDLDRNVGIGESRLMVARLKGEGKNADLVVFHNLDHQLDDSDARAEMLDKADGFLRNSLGI